MNRVPIGFNIGRLGETNFPLIVIVAIYGEYVLFTVIIDSGLMG
ncbi:MAG: hypothetical protein QG574_3600 [Cyanobacteriota bacterium erpe_2018_sw_21hr_WHONDRS-SW48-000092_B_bin.40]|jgi:hypothetical protein|nr:hypothetical protein [Cyanobacteriota bacterium erpe_2018_sw_21hr_WHONDRS-SW48-000092_B_bin.40]